MTNKNHEKWIHQEHHKLYDGKWESKSLLEIPSCEAVERDMIKHMYSSTIIKPETTLKKK